MGFNFSPSIWFVCRFCRLTFSDVETLKEHKLACHLGECIGVKCIIFEERLLNEELEPEQQIGDQSQPVNRNSIKDCRNKIKSDYGFPQKTPFKNPYVLLTRITEQEINLSLNKSEDCDSQTFSLNDEIESMGEIELKKESVIYETPTLINPELNTDTNTIFQDVKAGEFIAASVVQDCDEASQIQFAPNLISPFVQDRYHNLPQQNVTISNTNLDLKAINLTSEPKRQQIVSSDEANYSDLNATKEELTDFKSDSFGHNLAIEQNDEQYQPTAPQEEEPLYRAPNQQAESISILICKSRPATGEAVEISPFAQSRYQHLPQQKLKMQNTNTDPEALISILESEHQQIISSDEANYSDSNFTKEEFASLNSNFIGDNLAVEQSNQHHLHITTPEQSPLNCEPNQEEESISLRICQSIPATSVAVEKAFICQICSVLFRKKTYLKRHMLCHSSIKPFRCSDCPSAFKRKQELHCHQVVHGKETKFKCRFCFKYLSANNALQIHERIHTGEKPFKCTVIECGYKATSNSALKRHTRQIH